MELTREEAIANFREHWNWQSKHPKVDKEDAPMVRGKRLTFDCFLCDYALQPDLTQIVNCNKCPIQWPSMAKTFMCEDSNDENRNDGLWLQWKDAHYRKDYKSSTAIAKQIANLPEREE